MPNDFPCDVFLSHSAKDKSVVRPLAERLRQDGLKVWFDEWVLKPGDSIPARIEDGMEHSRVLPLAHQKGEGARRAGEGCLSAQAFGSDWAQLEAGTFGRRNLRFRNPLNQERRFLPLRLDDDDFARRRFVEIRAPRQAEGRESCRLPLEKHLASS